MKAHAFDVLQEQLNKAEEVGITRLKKHRYKSVGNLVA